MSLDVRGLCGVSDGGIKREIPFENGTSKGSTIVFDIAWNHPGDYQSDQFHTCSVSMFVPLDELSIWREHIKHGRVLEIRLGKLVSRKTDDGKSFLSIKLNRKDVFPLSVPHWYKEKK